MKKLISATAISALLVASAAQAGGLAPAVEEQQEVIAIAPPQSNASPYIVPLLLLGFLAVASSASDTEGESNGTDFTPN